MFARILIKELTVGNGFRQLGMQDACDYMSSSVTLSLYMVCCFIITCQTFFLNPLACTIVSAPSGQGLINYMKNYCWVHGTVPYYENRNLYLGNRSTPWSDMDRDRAVYYQWLPLFFGFMGLACVLPGYLWQWIRSSWMSMDYTQVLQICRAALKTPDINLMNKKLDQACMTFCCMMNYNDPLSRRLTAFYRGQNNNNNNRQKKSSILQSFDAFVIHRRQNSLYWLLTLGYFIFKISLLVSMLLQMYFLCRLLGYDGNMLTFGPVVVNHLVSGRDWMHTGWFSRISHCLLHLPHLGVANTYTAQCTLSVNMLNEKICLFLWFWLLAVLLMNTISLWFWLSSLLWNSARLKFVKHLLVKLASDDSADSYLDVSLVTRRNVTSFVDHFLHTDGLLVLRMVHRDVGSWICSKLLLKLWNVAHLSEPEN